MCFEFGTYESLEADLFVLTPAVLPNGVAITKRVLRPGQPAAIYSTQLERKRTFWEQPSTCHLRGHLKCCGCVGEDVKCMKAPVQLWNLAPILNELTAPKKNPPFRPSNPAVRCVNLAGNPFLVALQ